MHLKVINNCVQDCNFQTHIISVPSITQKHFAFEIIRDGNRIGDLGVIIENHSCQIIKYSCVKNIDFKKCFCEVVKEISYEFPEITVIFVCRDNIYDSQLLECDELFSLEYESGKFIYNIKRIAVTAIKPSDGGLHLGHYFGNIKPLIDRQNLYDCVFVFADLQLLNTNKKYYNESNRIDNVSLMLRQLIALGVNPSRTKILLESQLKSHALSEFIKMSDFATDARIYRNPYIKAEKAKAVDNSKPIKMSVMNYPIMEALDFYLTNADVMFSNMDNKACVEFTNELYQKMYSAGLMPRKKIKLIHGFYDYLPGIDGNKMSKVNNNAIYFADSSNEIRKKVNKMYTDPNRISADTPGSIEKNVVFKFLRLFLPTESFSQIKKNYEDGKIKDIETKELLSELITDFISHTQKMSSEIDEKLIYTIIGDVKK